VTLEEIEARIAEHQDKMAELRVAALKLPEVRQMPGAWVRGWLESHGASPKEAQGQILTIINANRIAADSPSLASSGSNW
jgi:hypothetical protein